MLRRDACTRLPPCRFRRSPCPKPTRNPPRSPTWLATPTPTRWSRGRIGTRLSATGGSYSWSQTSNWLAPMPNGRPWALSSLPSLRQLVAFVAARSGSPVGPWSTTPSAPSMRSTSYSNSRKRRRVPRPSRAMPATSSTRLRTSSAARCRTFCRASGKRRRARSWLPARRRWPRLLLTKPARPKPTMRSKSTSANGPLRSWNSRSLEPLPSSLWQPTPKTWNDFTALLQRIRSTVSCACGPCAANAVGRRLARAGVLGAGQGPKAAVVVARGRRRR